MAGRTPRRTRRTRPLQLGFALEVGARSDVGQVRERNEDSWVVTDLAEGRQGAPLSGGVEGALLAVCDGLGGAVGGDVASALAARTIAERAGAVCPRDAAAGASLLRGAIEEANRRVHEAGARDEGLTGMGTTATVVMARAGWAAVAHVGDSRAYLLRAGRLHPLTRDQSLVVALLDTGIITPAQAETLQGVNVLLQAVGTEDHVQVVAAHLRLRQDDVLLLCSDGLTAVLADEAIAEALGLALGGRGAATRAADELVRAVDRMGAPDNVTVVVARVLGAELPPAADEAPALTAVR